MGQLPTTYRKEKHFINLTNGIEAIPQIPHIDGFIRIQSSHCEKKCWDLIIRELDNNFLMWLALGYTIYVYDFGARKIVPRAIYQGLEWIKFVLYKRWFNKDYIPIVKGHNCTKYFEKCYNQLSYEAKRKVDYFKKFLLTDNIRLIPVTDVTYHDGDYSYYKNMLQQYVNYPLSLQ